MSFEYERAHGIIKNNGMPERIEINANGVALKKYGATPTSWPQYSAIQQPGVGHNQLDKIPMGAFQPNANPGTYGPAMKNLFG